VDKTKWISPLTNPSFPLVAVKNWRFEEVQAEKRPVVLATEPLCGPTAKTLLRRFYGAK
jgi:hypothetical protein